MFISARKIETVLAILLIRAGQVVALDQLITEIWGEDPPRRAAAGIHVYISQLRKFLNRPGPSGSVIVTRPPGYVLHMRDDEIDVDAFMRLMNKGRMHARERRHQEAAACFENALAMWRGPAVGDLRDGCTIMGFVTWLEEARLECIEILMNSYLELGHHRELVGRLYSLTREYPLYEAFYRHLMLALYRSERQAEALGVYQSARRVLNNELGLEPCRALRDLQRAILTATDDFGTDIRETPINLLPRG
ncbi:AfsR/SARP family transcriptional regulator [Sphaerisporangium aureirubrum]|uniref:BTAD domain-containing putative transcriptional regulator n=1 Tax=Sphaerisporangium aureirubrum TaxID=1544736 RepID=A0ABW1NQU4_9ACTN